MSSWNNSLKHEKSFGNYGNFYHARIFDDDKNVRFHHSFTKS